MSIQASIVIQQGIPVFNAGTGVQWQLQFSRYFNISAYGATPVTSPGLTQAGLITLAQTSTAQAATNTAAIQAACDAAQAAGGGTVFIPSGVWPFYINTPSTGNSLLAGGVRMLGYSNVRIEGADKYHSLLVHTGTQATVWYPTIGGGGGFIMIGAAGNVNATNCHITKIGMIGLYPYLTRQATIGEDAAYRQGVYFRVDTSVANGSVVNCSVTDCYFKNIESESFYGDGDSTHQQVNNHIDRNHFYRCASNAVNFGVAASGAVDCSGDDNEIQDCGGSPAQIGGVGTTFCRNKISMPSGFYTSSDQVLVVNALRCKVDDNIFRSIHADFSTVGIVNVGYSFDSNTFDTSVQRNIFHACRILNNSSGHAGIIVISASTVGAFTKGTVVRGNQIIECSEANHAGYPDIHGIRCIGTEVTTGVIEGNIIDNRGIANGIKFGVTTDAGSNPSGVIVGQNYFSSDVATPYNFNVAILSDQTYRSGSAAWNPPNVATNAETTTTLAVTESALGDLVAVGFSNSLQGMKLTGYVSVAGTVTVVLRNDTGGALDLASGTLRARCFRQ